MADPVLPEDDALTAGEYVLGTLDADEHRAVSRRLLTESSLVALVTDWQERLSPLLLAGPEAAPSGQLWQRIDAATRPYVAANDNHRVTRWQVATVAAALVAIVTSSLAMWQRPAPPMPAAPSRDFVQQIAALSSDGGMPALLVTYDAATGKMRVMPVNISGKPGHSMELWVIAGKAAPKSIGLMPAKGMAAMDNLHVDPSIETTIAVSVEPLGGSPTGLPTGPVVYSGRMIALSKS